MIRIGVAFVRSGSVQFFRVTWPCSKGSGSILCEGHERGRGKMSLFGVLKSKIPFSFFS